MCLVVADIESNVRKSTLIPRRWCVLLVRVSLKESSLLTQFRTRAIKELKLADAVSVDALRLS